MVAISICFGFFMAIFKLILKLRLGIPLIYLILCSTILAPWATAYETLSMVIFFGLLAIVAASWIYTAVKYIRILIA